MAAACAAVLATIDVSGTATMADILSGSPTSDPLTNGAIDLLMDRGEIVDSVGGLARPGGLNLTTTYGATINSIRETGRALSRSELQGMFPDIDVSYLDAIVHRGLSSGQLKRDGGRISATVGSALRHVSEEDVLSVFPDDRAISPRLLRTKLAEFDTRRLWMVLERLVSTGKIASVSHGSYAKNGVVTDALQVTSRIRALLSSKPKTSFTAKEVAANLNFGDLQYIRTTLCHLFQDGSIWRVSKGLYKHKAPRSLTPLEKLVLDHLSANPDQRKVDIAAALSRGRGVINRAVSALVGKGLLWGRNQRFRLALPERASRPANSRLDAHGEAGAL
jgi:hypothetical protein